MKLSCKNYAPIWFTQFFLFFFYLLCHSSYAETKWNSEFENLAVDLTYKWKDTATCLNLILDHYHDAILDKSFYDAISGVPSFKVGI